MGLAVLGSSLNTNWFGLADLDGDRFSSLHGTCEVINATHPEPGWINTPIGEAKKFICGEVRIGRMRLSAASPAYTGWGR